MNAICISISLILSPLIINSGSHAQDEPSVLDNPNTIAFSGKGKQIYLSDSEGKSQTKLLNAKGDYLAWSPDGKKLAFLSDRDGSQQLYVRYLDTGDEAKLTNLSYSPGNVVWSPDSKHLAFTLFTSASEKPLFTGMPAKPAKAEWAPSGNYIEKMNYRFDGAGYVQRVDLLESALVDCGGNPENIFIFLNVCC